MNKVRVGFALTGSFCTFVEVIKQIELLAKDYDIIMLAPQISYLLPQVEVLLPEKDIVVIPTKIFAMNDFSGALMIINELLENKEKN